MSEKRILDEETKENLLGYLPFDSEQTVEFVIDVPNPQYKPVFYVRCYTQSEMAQVQANSVSLELAQKKLDLREKVEPKTKEVLEMIDAANLEYSVKLAKIVSDSEELTRHCIKDIKNLFYANTKNALEYKADSSGGMDKEQFKLLPNSYIGKIAAFLRKISGLQSFEFLGLKS